MSRWCVAPILIASVLVAGVLVANRFERAEGGEAGPGSSEPPFDLSDATVIEEGLRLFRANCTHYCHNPEGRAARAPALRGRDLTPDFVFRRIGKGLAPMPAYETSLSSEQIWKLVAYVESLAKARD